MGNALIHCLFVCLFKIGIPTTKEIPDRTNLEHEPASVPRLEGVGGSLE